MKTTGRVNGIISNIVIVKADGAVGQNEICYVYTGDTKMMAEVIKVVGDSAYVQVFDSTRGLKIGDRVEFEGHMLEVTLAPGLLSRNYDGLQNDLEKMDGLFIARGSITDPVDFSAEWEFAPLAKAGDKVSAASWLGEVKEQWVSHKIMVPFTMTGNYTVKSIVAAGKYKVTDTVAVVTDDEGREHGITMVQKWPVKQAVRCYVEKPRPSRVMVTGVRAIDTFNPMAEGGTGFIPGPFGAGKTVLQHAISKQADADIIIMVACGERANEVVEIFKEFPELIDPRTGHNLMERTIIVCNTSNMPVAAREASVYTGMAIGEYYRARVSAQVARAAAGQHGGEGRHGGGVKWRSGSAAGAGARRLRAARRRRASSCTMRRPHRVQRRTSTAGTSRTAGAGSATTTSCRRTGRSPAGGRSGQSVRTLRAATA